VNVPDAASLNINGNQLTIEAWIKRVADSGYLERIVAKENNGNSYSLQYFLQISDQDKLHFGFAPSGSTYTLVTGTTNLAVGTWYHVAGVYDGSQLRVYVNGNLDGSKAQAGNIYGAAVVGTHPLSLGRLKLFGAYEYGFSGVMDEVKIYNRALDPGEFNPLPGGPGSPASSAAGVGLGKIIAVPNPIREDRVTFKEPGVGGKAVGVATRPMKLEIYDLAGRKVFNTDWLDTNAFEWFLQNNNGETLANGVYIYVVYTMDENGSVKVNSKDKFVILR